MNWAETIAILGCVGALAATVIVLVLRLPKNDADVIERVAQNYLAAWERGYQFSPKVQPGERNMPGLVAPPELTAPPDDPPQAEDRPVGVASFG